MQSFTLFQLNEFIRRVVALNFPEPLWISCEIGQLNEARGHFFFDLVEKGEAGEQVIAQSEAVLWQRTYRGLRRRLGRELDSLLAEGLAVRMQVRVDFNERYGLKLIIEDIDPAYTLGQLELVRRQTIEWLRAKQLLDRNQRLPLPPVIQRLAVLSSERAAGYQDYRRELENNSYGYRYHNVLFPAAVQGKNAEPELLAQLQKIRGRQQEFDGVVIIRGGGARLDLAAFDGRELCQAVAEFPLPVITGIGHDIDETVLDLVAHTALKTPTAVADFFIARSLQFESQLLDHGRRLQLITGQQLHRENITLERLENKIASQARQRLSEAGNTLDHLATSIPQQIHFKLLTSQQQLDKMEQALQLLSPEAALRRGFTLTYRDGHPIRSATDLEPGQQITTRFHDGKVESRVEKKEK